METNDITKVPNIDEDEMEDIGKKKKRRISRRKFEGKLKLLVTVLAISMSAYQLYTAIFTINPMQQRAFHLMFVLTLVFLLYPATAKSPTHRPSISDCIFVMLSILSVSNIIIRFDDLARTGGHYTQTDLIFGVLTILLVIEAARRTVGWALPILAMILIAYGFLGRYVPGPLMHAGFSWKRIVSHLTLTTEGIYGQILGVSSTYIYLFILFGAFLAATGMSKTFNDIALGIAGSLRGGPAKVSVLASGFMGSISGSTSANVVTTGAFTIPLMRKLGYKDYFASATEAAASAGGQIMPPIMGAASFIIADSLGVPFATVLRAALIPAVLYYFSVWVMVDLRARKENIYGLKKNELPKIKDTLIKRGHLLVPLFGIIYMLIVGYNAITAALVGMALSVVTSLLKKDTRIKLDTLLKAMESGALGALSVAIACGIIGVIIGVVSLTGAILAAGAAILKLSGGILVVTLVLTMLTAIILGMGLPTTACYVLTSTVAAPAIVKLGVAPMQAHMFVFYYGILSSITPPVATGAYTAAGLSGADPNKTGWAAMRLAIAGFLIPFMFIYSPELLLPSGVGFITIIHIIISSLIGIVSLGWSIEGFFKRKLKFYERVLCAVAAILLIDSKVVTDIIGYASVAIIYFSNTYHSKTVKTLN